MANRSNGKVASGTRSLRTVGYLVKVLSQLNHRRIQVLLQPYDLTPFHCLVLRCLWEEDGLPVSDITQRLQEVGGTMTGVLDRMEDRQLVSRVRDRDDRRVFRIYLTKKGKELEDEIMPLLDGSRKQLFKGISQKDLSFFSKLAEQLIANCEEILAEDDDR